MKYSVYRHFKGGLYQIVCTATMESTGEELIIYRQYAPPNMLICFAPHWARTKENFFEEVEVEGKMVPRFKMEEQ